MSDKINGEESYPNAIPSKLKVHKIRSMAYSLDLAELVLDEVEMIQQRVGERRVGRVVIEG